MTLGHHVLAPLLLVMVFATSGCGDKDDASRSAPTPERDGGEAVPAAESTEGPATGEKKLPREARTSGAKRSTIGRRAAVMRRLHGRRIRVDRVSVRLDRETLACGRAGRDRLRCVQPTFPADRLVGPDATFFVHRNSAGRLVIRGARLTSY